MWLWGTLGGRAYPRPCAVERLRDATIVSLACGVDHLAMVTGDARQLEAKAQELHFAEMREEALEHERASYEQARVDDGRRAAAERERVAKEKADRLAEKRRVKLLQRLDKNRKRLIGREQLKREAEAAKADAKAKEEQAKAMGLEDEKAKKKGGKKKK